MKEWAKFFHDRGSGFSVSPGSIMLPRPFPRPPSSCSSRKWQFGLWRKEVECCEEWSWILMSRIPGYSTSFLSFFFLTPTNIFLYLFLRLFVFASSTSSAVHSTWYLRFTKAQSPRSNFSHPDPDLTNDLNTNPQYWFRAVPNMHGSQVTRNRNAWLGTLCLWVTNIRSGNSRVIGSLNAFELPLRPFAKIKLNKTQYEKRKYKGRRRVSLSSYLLFVELLLLLLLLLSTCRVRKHGLPAKNSQSHSKMRWKVWLWESWSHGMSSNYAYDTVNYY